MSENDDISQICFISYKTKHLVLQFLNRSVVRLNMFFDTIKFSTADTCEHK